MASRVSTVLPKVSRNSRTASMVGERSPFRSQRASTRIRAARAMIDQRKRETRDLERMLSRTLTPKEETLLANRLLATRNNLMSWETYMTTYERETRAVVGPSRKR